jgi:uncharacterized Zn finger protein
MWDQFFKPEVRHSGQKYVDKELISISNPSETEVIGYVRSSGSFKVNLKTATVASSSFQALCTCPASKKGQLCKHIWAVLSVALNKYPDFFYSKNDIEQPSKAPTEKSAYQIKQNEYRKAQYQKMKEQKKLFKNQKQNSSPEYPREVEKAIQYFTQNGFPFESQSTEEEVQSAKKKLSRLFHPDLGGSHEEIIELNRQSEILIQFFKK